MAAGLEYRDESISDVPDDQFQRGLIFGTEAVSAAASRDIKSAYIEFSVPLLETLELSLAGRYDDYSDFGDTTNPKLALRWAPIDELAFRASWGTGFRAPSLAQIGLGPSQESQFFKDTFSCIDQGIDPASTACPSLDYTIIFSGNPNLNPEESDTLNVGAAWQPSDMWRVSVDYWDINQDDKIDEVPFGFIYEQECNNQASTVCVRGAPVGGNTLGPLAQLNSGFVNIGEQSVKGIDLGGSFASSLGAGVLTLGLEYSHLIEFEGRAELGRHGIRHPRPDRQYEYPEDRFVLSGDYSMDAWDFYGTVNFTGSFRTHRTRIWTACARLRHRGHPRRRCVRDAQPAGELRAGSHP
jgi:outer membrane receptor protein involved in Fe transport